MRWDKNNRAACTHPPRREYAAVLTGGAGPDCAQEIFLVKVEAVNNENQIGPI